MESVNLYAHIGANTLASLAAENLLGMQADLAKVVGVSTNLLLHVANKAISGKTKVPSNLQGLVYLYSSRENQIT